MIKILVFLVFRFPGNKSRGAALLGGAQGVHRPIERLSPSSVFLAMAWASTQWDVPETPSEGGIQGALEIAQPPQRTSLDVEEQQLYSELLLDGQAPHPISKGLPSHPVKESHFSRLYPGSGSFVHDPEFMTIVEGRTRVTTTDWGFRDNRLDRHSRP
ncbi:hypothetical protein ATANTOWER_022859 [Ataeniobius toweri]|uniref:Uncharacterized protein n=1 Tax=Ataeniobius toweri TaxID=208326 RepID=A0ABU7B143_9TELE|nr:hypothetical protein [Ataeniobius toweri]